MAITATGNALGSTDPRDLYTNAQNFDLALNSPLPSWNDRFNKRRETWAGLEAMFQDFLQSQGSSYLGEYAANVTFTRRNQYVVRNGVAYRPAISSTLPLVLTGTWATDQPKLYAFDSDALLRSDLASSDAAKGAHLISYKGQLLDTLLPVWPEMYGAIGDGVANDTVAVQAWLDALSPYSEVSGKPGSKYRIVDGFGIQVEGTTVRDTNFVYPVASQTYYHAVRITANNCKFQGNRVESPAGLARDQTGFGILIGNCDNTEVSGNTVSRIGSAAIWVTSATNFRIFGNTIFYPLADGIHVSDSCRNGIICENNLAGCHDDSLAVVGDTPAASAPSNIVICDNIVDGSIDGHGVVLIACATVIVKGNILRGTGSAGIGSYFWQLTAAPVAKDWANNCLIIGNTIVAPSQNAKNVNNVAGIFAGSARGWVVEGNDIASASSETLTSACAVRVIACQDMLIQSNKIRDSASYGIWNPEINANAAANFTGLVIRNNYFQNIQKQAIRLNSASDMGYTAILGNEFYQCSYDGGTPNLIFVTKTGNNLLAIFGNRNIDGDKEFYYDPASCLNVTAADNTPDVLITYTPAAVPLSGAWTSSTASGAFYSRGRTVFFRATVSVTSKGTGVGIKITLPKAMRSGGFGSFTGRENALTGNMLIGLVASSTQIQVQTYNNADPVSGNGAVVEINGWFLGAR